MKGLLYLYIILIIAFIIILVMLLLPVKVVSETSTTSSHRPVTLEDEWWIVQMGEPREAYLIIEDGQVVEITKEEFDDRTN